MTNHKCLKVEISKNETMNVFARKNNSMSHDKKKKTFETTNFCIINLWSFALIYEQDRKGLVQTTMLIIGVASNKRLMVDDMLY